MMRNDPPGAGAFSLDYSTCERVLDLDQFHELMDAIGVELLPDILGEFITELRARQEQILHAQRRSEISELKAIAHALKGSSGTIGAKHILQASKELEITCADGAWQDVSQATEKVTKEIVAAESVLQALAGVEMRELPR